jgi:hypothetical protein
LAKKLTLNQNKAPPRWEDLPPTDKMIAYANAGGKVLGKVVAAGMFLGTGAEVFHIAPDFIDPTRAADIFAVLAAYYGVPYLAPHRLPGKLK